MNKQNLLVSLIIILTFVLIGIIGYFVLAGQEKTAAVKVFFSNSEKDPQALECEKVYPVEREISRAKPIILTALEELLKGPTQEEQEKGYLTNINPGVIINDLVIENNIAKVDFSEQLEYQLGGSCRVIAIQAQIIETLKQFAEIDDVIISINGRIEDVLQP